ncbi:hypothetical protein [Salipiger bermudensis]|uniref:hypothetical protein n=1 Tax=Salipiger bermudensis TaxID=344736 RepID=UPI001CD472C9|nr:hypothetical protein [Salipiger bermudensis]MCA0964017.1 hypothetical protein [Salipiger bermudensis]
MDADKSFKAPEGDYETCRGLYASEAPECSGEAIRAAICAIPVALVVAVLTSLRFGLKLASALALYAVVGSVVMLALLTFRLWRAGALS